MNQIEAAFERDGEDEEESDSPDSLRTHKARQGRRKDLGTLDSVVRVLLVGAAIAAVCALVIVGAALLVPGVGGSAAIVAITFASVWAVLAAFATVVLAAKCV